jgi:hypothetical protein
MRTPLVRLCIPALLLTVALAACGGDDDEEATPTFTVETLAPVTVDTSDIPVPSVPDTGDIPIPSVPDTGDIPIPPVNTGDLPFSISATVGVDTGPERVEHVPLGSTVILMVTNPNSTDEFHLHGYELGDGDVMEAGQTATFNFVADEAGEFELESHESDDVLLVLSVD